MDTTQALKDAENALRDFIAMTLRKMYGDNWEEESGVSSDRLDKWRERKKIEEKRQEAGVVEERLIYYADFYDLRTILKKHWSGDFSEAFGEWKTMEVWLTELEKLRDPDAHRRELLPHQQYLVLGISGEIRTRIVRFRSKQETSESYFPRIESVRDNFGNIWTIDNLTHSVPTDMNLREGDTIEFVVTASDPFGDSLQYGILSERAINWQDSNVLSMVLERQHIGRNVKLSILIRSHRDYHAARPFDDHVDFWYNVLPAKSRL